MVSKPFRESAYYKQAKGIKGYVSFQLPLNREPTAAERRKARKYYQLIYGRPITLDDGTKDWVTGLAQGGKYPLKVRGAALAKAQRYAGHTAKGLRVAFVPWDGEHKPQLKIKGDTVVDTTNGQRRQVFLFPDSFANDAAEGNYLKHVSKAIKRAKGATAFGVVCGLAESRELFNGEGLAKRVAELIEAYGDVEANNWFGNWLHGIIAYKAKSFKSAVSLRQRRLAYVDKQKKERANAKRREARRQARGRH